MLKAFSFFRPLLATLALAAAALAGPVWAEGRAFTAEDLVAIDRVSDAHIAPDGQWVVYDRASLNAEGTKRTHAIWLVSPGAQPVKLVTGSNPRWAPDSQHVYFLAPGAAAEDKGTTQVWSLPAGARCAPGRCDTHPPVQVTHLALDVDSFRISPDGKMLVVSMAVLPDAEDPAATKARLEAKAKLKTSGVLYDKLFVRHWDTWADGTKNHLFSLALGADGVASGAPVPLTPGFDGDVPGKPFGGDDDYMIWPTKNPQGGTDVVFSARVAGRTEPWSTNFDNFSVPITGGKPPVNLTADNLAWDATPVASPNGQYAAYRAMKRPGFEADRFGIILVDMATGKKRELAPGWDRSADQIAFSTDSHSIYATAGDVGHQRLFRIDIETGAVKPVTKDGHVSAFEVAHTGGGDMILYSRDALDSPPQLFYLNAEGQTTTLTQNDPDRLGGVGFSEFEQFTFKGWNDETVHGYVVKPHGWKPGVKYPTAFLIHGGPQGSFGDGWSYRWNPQVWAGWGFAVVMVDFHGSTGYGQGFTDAISGHWGDRPLEDLQKGWAAAQAKYPWVDGSRACAAGASYGGFMTYWIAGVWNQPWKCLVDHDGVFDNRMMGYSTEELWFSEWENGHSTPWANPAAYEVFNPVTHVADWTKPMLVIHGAKDYRIPLEQGLAAFTALQRKGIESQFLTFPDENHWVLKPQNSLQWHHTVEAWMKKWTQ